MGVHHTYFIAANDVAALATLEVETHVIGPEYFVEVVDPWVQAGTLISLLTGAPYEDVVSDPAWSQMISDKEAEAFLTVMSGTFTSALADASDEKLEKVAGPWSETEEFSGSADPEQLVELLKNWREIAQTAVKQQQALYCVSEP